VSALHVAIVGAGPAGFYVADALLRKLPGSSIDLFERLPTPFGLVRGGVAPDHQGTKNIVRQFERTLGRPGVRLLGAVEIGRDLALPELRASYHAVVVCTGAIADRHLGIPGESLPGCYGSAAFVGWYNGVPAHAALRPALDRPALAVIGNGNVALDVVRILAKSPTELAGSDIVAHAARSLATAQITDILLIGRRGAANASFTAAELAELGNLDRAQVLVDAADIPASPLATADPEQRANAEKNIAILAGFAAQPRDQRPIRIRMLFERTPLAVLGRERVEALRLEHGGTQEDVPIGSLITAIGYRCAPIDGLPYDTARGTIANTDGRVAPGLYAAGWCRRGPQGVIPANRSDSLAVAEAIASDLAAHRPAAKPGPAAIDALLVGRGIRPVDNEGWLRINAAEIALGAPDKPREKIVDIAELLAAARAH
jgi:ferredoxin--NADP+ reductase